MRPKQLRYVCGEAFDEIAKLARKIDALGYRSLHTDLNKGTERSQSGEDHDGTDDGADRSSSNHVRTAMEAALRESGFEVLDHHEMEFQPLVKVIAEVT